MMGDGLMIGQCLVEEKYICLKRPTFIRLAQGHIILYVNLHCSARQSAHL